MTTSIVDALNKATSTASGGKTDPTAASTSDRFLKLLVTQMQNQDPLNPMDNAQVTSQMAQIETVSGIEKLNTSIAAMSAQFGQLQAIQGAGLIGHGAVVPGNLLEIANGVGQAGFELSGPADAVQVEVLSPAGVVLDTLQLGAQSAGVHSFNWNSGSATNDSGLSFRVTATQGGAKTAATTLMNDTVQSVSGTNSGLQLQMARAGAVPYANVRAFD
jgi:flagellar basal-body rod modification protein FlgD